MKKVVLIQPIAGKYEYVGLRIPEGLLSIASILIKEGYDVKLLDTRINRNWKKDLLEALKSDPICVGITSMTGPQIYYALKIAKLIKKNSDIPIVWGGTHASLLPEETIKNKYVDIIVQGEGEITFFELIKALETQKPLESVKGIWYKERSTKELRQTESRPFIENLDSLPDLPYFLVNLKDYFSFNFNNRPSITLLTSRGCPFRCSFCYNTAFNKRMWRAFSAERVIEKLEYIVKALNIKNIFIQDDYFFSDMERVEKIVKEIIEKKFNINWALSARSDTIEKMSEMSLKRLWQSGCRNIDIGFESGSPKILKLILKDITVPQIISANRKLAKFGFSTKYAAILGIPTETDKESKQTIELALNLEKENKNAYTFFFAYCPFPGTSLYNLAIQHGFSPPNSLENWSMLTNISWYFYYPSWLSKKDIKRLDNLVISSRFHQKKAKYKIKNKFIRLLFNIYRPIANFRFKYDFYYFPVERYIERFITRSRLILK